MDALDLLEQQHRDVCALLSRLAEAPLGAGSDDALLAALRAVEAHIRVEEAYVYIACGSRIGASGRLLLLPAREEHERIVSAARVALSMPRSGPRLSARIAALRDRFERHVDFEEDIVFPKLKRSLCDEELDVLGDELERAYARLVAAPHFALDPAPSRGELVRASSGASRRGARRPTPPSAV